MFQRLWIVLSQSPMLPSLIVLFICTSYEDVKVFHPHRWLDYMRSVLFRRTPSIDTVTNFYPRGRWVDSAPHTSRFCSSWILVINVLIQNLLFSVGFPFFLKDHLVTFGYVTVVTTYLYNNKNFMKSCQLSKMLVFRTMGGVHVLRSCVSCLLLCLFVNPYRLEQSKKKKFVPNSARSRPWDKGGGGKRSCGPSDKGEAVSKKDFSPGPSSGSATA